MMVGITPIKTENVQWRVQWMGSTIRNRVLKLTQESNQIMKGPCIIKEGWELNTFYLPKSAGVDPLTGAPLYYAYEDMDDKGNVTGEYITTDYTKATTSKYFQGSRLPDLYGSISTTLNLFNCVDLSIMSTYSIGGKMLDYMYQGSMENMYYNWKDDYYVCPMGQHMEHVGHNKSVSDNGYVSWIDTYRAQRCEGCPLRGQCFKRKGNRTINVNHQLKRYKKKAFERLTSERGLFHRSKRPVEPEAVFGQIKTDKQYKRFRHRGFSKIQMDFGILAMAFNLQKLIKNVGKDQIKAVMEAFSTLFGLLLASLWTFWRKFRKEESSVNKNRQLSNRNLIAA